MSSKSAQAAVEQWAAQHQMIPDQLDPLALTLRDAYVRNRRSMFPAYHLNSTKYDATFWRRVAILVHTSIIDPDVYVAMAFHLYGGKTYPEALLSQNVQFAYNTEQVDRSLTDTIELDLKLFTARLQTYKQKGDRSAADLLLDRDVCPSDLFAWCVAKAMHLDDVAAQREGSSQTQLLRPAYRKVYAKAFPGVIDGHT